MRHPDLSSDRLFYNFLVTHLSCHVNPSRHTHISGIDGLRAFAVLSVIFFHFNPAWLPGGFTGVDVFFVISGYVVTGSLLRSDASSLKTFLMGFYARRLARIYPALLLCLLVTVAFKTWLIPKSWLSLSTDYTGLAAFFGLSNLALIFFSDGYFSPRVEFNVFTHTWSLAIEEQFYLIYPFMLYFYLKPQVSTVWNKSVSYWAIIFLTLVSLGVSFWQSAHAVDQAYYLLPSRFWELGCGALLSIMHSRHVYQARKWSLNRAMLLAGLAAIFYGFFKTDTLLFPAPGALPAVIGTMLLIHGLVISDTTSIHSPSFLSNPALVYIGKLSYSLYLWHWPVIVISRWTWGDDTWWKLGVAGLLTALLASFSYHVVEGQFSYAKLRQNFSDKRVVMLGSSTLLVLMLGCFAVFKMHAYLTLSVTGNASVWFADTVKRMPPAMLAQTPQDKPRLYVLGDSHVGAYGTLLGMLQREQGWVVQPYFAGGCPVADLLRPASVECQGSVTSALNDILAEARPGDFVLLASLRMFRLGDQWRTFTEAEVNKAINDRKAVAPQVYQEAREVVHRLQQAGLRVIIDAPKPIFKSPPARCSDSFNHLNPICGGGFVMPRAFLEAHRREVMSDIARLQHDQPGLLVWDAFPFICPTEQCHAFDGQWPLFFDGDHLSGYGNRMLYPHFLNFMQHAVGVTKS